MRLPRNQNRAAGLVDVEGLRDTLETTLQVVDSEFIRLASTVSPSRLQGPEDLGWCRYRRAGAGIASR
jgi:hypothetical protein